MDRGRPGIGRFLATAAAVAALAGGLGACGESEGTDGTDITGELRSCLEEEGLLVAVRDVNELEPKEVAAGAEGRVTTTNPDDDTSLGDILVFEATEDAEAWRAKQEADYLFLTEVHGRMVLTTFEDDTAREALTDCAEASA